MKKIYFLFLLLITGTMSYGQDWTNVLLKDDFNYANDALLTDNGWVKHSGTTTPPKVGASNGFNHPGYLTTVLQGNAAILTAGGTDDIHKTFAQQTTGAVYASFLVKVSAATTTGDYFIHFGEALSGSTNFKARFFAKLENTITNKLAFGIAQSTGTANYTAFNYDLNTTYLIVLKLSIVDGATNDVASFIVNPALNVVEPVTGWVTNTDAAGTDFVQGSIRFRQGTNTPTAAIDGLRVTNVWPFSISDAALDVEKNEIANFSLYPNPVKGGKVFINSANNYAERSVAIFDVLGKQVVSQKGTQNSIDVSHLNKGVYIIKVAEEGKVATRKLVIE